MENHETTVTENELDSFARNLLDLLNDQKKGKTKAEIAHSLGISVNTLQSYTATGDKKKIPSLTNAIKIANYFGVSLDWLCGKENKSPKTLKDIANIVYTAAFEDDKEFNISIGEFEDESHYIYFYDNCNDKCKKFNVAFDKFCTDFMKIMDIYFDKTIPKEMADVLLKNSVNQIMPSEDREDDIPF